MGRPIQNIYRCNNYTKNYNLNKTCKNCKRCVIYYGEYCYDYKETLLKKRNEILPIGKNMPEDYCVDCEYFDAGDCFAADLSTKYVGDIIHIVKPTAKILKFEKREKKDS